MKRFLLSIFILFCLSVSVNAAHIKGGYFAYRYLGPGSGTNLRYQVTLTVYMICNPSTAQVSNPINFSIFNAGTNTFIRNESVSLSQQYNLNKAADEPCITGEQSGCYYTVVVYDLPSVELPVSADGYIISYQRCCRIAGINNVSGSGSVGNTFSINIIKTIRRCGASAVLAKLCTLCGYMLECLRLSFSHSLEAPQENMISCH